MNRYKLSDIKRSVKKIKTLREYDIIYIYNNFFKQNDITKKIVSRFRKHLKMANLSKLSSLKYEKKRLYIVDEKCSCLRLYQTNLIKIHDIVIQIVNQKYDSYHRTIEYIGSLGFCLYGINLTTNIPSKLKNIIHYYDSNLYKILDGIIRQNKKRENTQYFADGVKKLGQLDIDLLDKSYILQKHISSINSTNDYVPLIYRLDELYLKNVYYRLNNEYVKDTTKIIKFLEKKRTCQNFYDEILYENLNRFHDNPKKYLSQRTIVLLDPTKSDERSGISTYLQNISMFYVTYLHEYFDNILYLKNNFVNNNREAFRKYIGESFNKYTMYNTKIFFVDSDAHYPGYYLNPIFRKVVVLHCSSVLAAIKNGKRITKTNIAQKEVENIKKSNYIISPTLHHKNVQIELYEDILKEKLSNLQISSVPNYIHEEYNQIIGPLTKKYDLLWVGRPQKLKGFDILKHFENRFKVFKIHNDPKIPDQNTLIDKSDTISLFLNKRNVYRTCKCFIELSAYHSYSYTVLEAINNKLFLILNTRCHNYPEIFGNQEIEKYICYIDLEDIETTTLKITEFIQKINNFSNEDLDDMDKIYNDFLFKNFKSNYLHHQTILSQTFSSKKLFRSFDGYNDYLKDKKVVIVANSNSIQPNDGEFIDTFDIVVRLNKALSVNNPQKYGSKNNVLYSCLNESPHSGNLTEEYYNNVVINNIDWIVKAFPNLQWSGSFSFDQDLKRGATYDNYMFELYNRDPLRTSTVDLYHYKIIEANIQARPNTGVLAILDILNYDVKILYLKGFTLFKGGYDSSYRQQNEQQVLSYMKKFNYHKQYPQNLFLRKILSISNNVKIDQTLNDILKNL